VRSLVILCPNPREHFSALQSRLDALEIAAKGIFPVKRDATGSFFYLTNNINIFFRIFSSLPLFLVSFLNAFRYLHKDDIYYISLPSYSSFVGYGIALKIMKKKYIVDIRDCYPDLMIIKMPKILFFLLTPLKLINKYIFKDSLQIWQTDYFNNLKGYYDPSLLKKVILVRNGSLFDNKTLKKKHPATLITGAWLRQCQAYEQLNIHLGYAGNK
jgi:hypothetical protein